MTSYLKESIDNLNLILKDKNLKKLRASISKRFETIFGFNARHLIQVDEKSFIIATKEKDSLKKENFICGFTITFNQLSNSEFEIAKYSYLIKNDEYYFRFDGDLNEKEKNLEYLICHPICHLHLKESGNPRIQTAIMSPFDFLRFIKDITNDCKG